MLSDRCEVALKWFDAARVVQLKFERNAKNDSAYRKTEGYINSSNWLFAGTMNALSEVLNSANPSDRKIILQAVLDCAGHSYKNDTMAVDPKSKNQFMSWFHTVGTQFRFKVSKTKRIVAELPN